MKKWIYTVLILFFVGVFLFSAYQLIDYFLESRKQAAQFDELADIVAQAQQTKPPAPTEDNTPDADPTEYSENDKTTEVTEPTQAPPIPVEDPETGEQVMVLPEYATIYTMNNDLVGWIQLEGTELNYPVMQTPDYVDYYLYRNFKQEYSTHGCVYVREQCDVETPSDNVTIYGHNMKDGSMFAPLHKYENKKFWKSHPTLKFDTLTQRNTYEILSVFLATASVGEGFTYHEFVNAQSPEAFDQFVATCKNLSLYDTGVTAQYGDKLITLSTCDYSQENGRLVVVAKRIPEKDT